jgi:hypothetical protein
MQVIMVSVISVHIMELPINETQMIIGGIVNTASVLILEQKLTD